MPRGSRARGPRPREHRGHGESAYGGSRRYNGVLGYLTSSTSSRSTRTYRPPASDPMTVRTAPADDLAQVVRVHADLKDPAPAEPVAGDADIVRVIHDALDQVLESLLEHLRPRCPARSA